MENIDTENTEATENTENTENKETTSSNKKDTIASKALKGMVKPIQDMGSNMKVSNTEMKTISDENKKDIQKYSDDEATRQSGDWYKFDEDGNMSKDGLRNYSKDNDKETYNEITKEETESKEPEEKKLFDCDLPQSLLDFIKNMKQDTSKGVEKVKEGVGKVKDGAIKVSKKITETLSDEDLKNIYGDDLDEDIINNFAKIAAIDFTYKPEAQKEYAGTHGMDGDEHIGVKAQDLVDNPATKGTVEKTENGDLAVKTDHLTLSNTAAIADLSRKVLEIEELLKKLS